MNKPNNISEIYNILNENQISVIQEIRDYCITTHHAKEILFPNMIEYKTKKGWIYINYYKRKNLILGFANGRNLCLQYPFLKLVFDEILLSVAKIKIYSLQQYQIKNYKEIIDLTLNN